MNTFTIIVSSVLLLYCLLILCKVGFYVDDKNPPLAANNIDNKIIKTISIIIIICYVISLIVIIPLFLILLFIPIINILIIPMMLLFAVLLLPMYVASLIASESYLDEPVKKKIIIIIVYIFIGLLLFVNLPILLSNGDIGNRIGHELYSRIYETSNNKKNDSNLKTSITLKKRSNGRARARG